MQIQPKAGYWVDRWIRSLTVRSKIRRWQASLAHARLNADVERPLWSAPTGRYGSTPVVHVRASNVLNLPAPAGLVPTNPETCCTFPTPLYHNREAKTGGAGAPISCCRDLARYDSRTVNQALHWLCRCRWSRQLHACFPASKTVPEAGTCGGACLRFE